MNQNNLTNKMITATKWSMVTEIIAKLIIPITNMILARILAPEAFGVVATITMIVSFADMFTDAGFQKYLVQHEFNTEEEKIQATNVAFWTNLFISLLMWLGISLFSEQLAWLVGNEGMEKVIVVACLQLPLTSFSSIQMAVYRRDFNFKDLFLIRVVGICIPFVITIPLALLGYSYWALIIGNICGKLFNAVALTIKSKWKPILFYKISILKEMLSFSIWSLVEAISIWLTTWIDTFIIGSILSDYYLGIYKTSLTTVNTIFSLITASTTPILFSALSRKQDNEVEFNNIFFSMQKAIAYLIFPMAVGIYIYKDFITTVLLGSKWSEAGYVIGIWALTSSVVIVVGHYASEVYRAKGKPKLSFMAQILHLVVLVPVCFVTAHQDFITLVNGRAFVRLQFVVVHIILLQFIVKIPIKTTLHNIIIPIVCSLGMGCFGVLIQNISSGFIVDIVGIILCIIFYIGLLMCFPKSRKDIVDIINRINLVDKIWLPNNIRRKIKQLINP